MADNLTFEQQQTLGAPRLRPGFSARLLFWSMNLVYGRRASLRKFRVLEVVARVPYMAWEQVGYVAITHTHARPEFARDIHDEVTSIRLQQDNEFFHLLILEELLQQRGAKMRPIRDRVIPQLLAWAYYQLSWLLYVVNPRSSYALNAQFEDHAEHEYMNYAAEHPELESEPWVSEFSSDYGAYASVADVLRAIGLDERHHKNESLERIDIARFRARGSGRVGSRPAY